VKKQNPIAQLVLIVPVLFSLACPFTAAAAESPSATSATSDDPVPDHPALRDRFMFAFGGYHPNTSTGARPDPNETSGTDTIFVPASGWRARCLPGRASLTGIHTNRHFTIFQGNFPMNMNLPLTVAAGRSGRTRLDGCGYAVGLENNLS
jgi:hypothetical protein